MSSVAIRSPPATTVARLRCTSLPTPVAMAAGSMPTVATVAVISTGRSRSVAPATTASMSGRPESRSRLRFATMMTPFITATPNRAMKPTADDTLRVTPVTCSAISPPSVASGTTRKISPTWRKRAEFGEQQHEHESRTSGRR